MQWKEVQERFPNEWVVLKRRRPIRKKVNVILKKWLL